MVIADSAYPPPFHADHPFSPVSVAFSKDNEMVVGNDGYYRDPRLRPVPYAHMLEDRWLELVAGRPSADAGAGRPEGQS